MPCKHTEDVCQRCLQKVQREDSSEEEEEVTTKDFPKKTKFSGINHLSESQKKYKIFEDSALLAATGYVAFYTGKFFLATFDFGVSVVKDILKNLLD